MKVLVYKHPQQILPLFVLNNYTDFSPTPKMDSDELMRLFRLFDKDGDGKITRNELSECVDKMGMYITDLELDLLIGRVDQDGDGCVDIWGFDKLYKSIMDESEGGKEDDMREAFNMFDKNGDGFISADELKAVLANVGVTHNHTDKECHKMITIFDLNGDGKVDFIEFKKMMTNRNSGFALLA